ncbi:MAG: class I SAM-dependent methyltransferase [Actinobacteria bacterium]|nr:class I SAM-dependent methyltransferase [Actinomycetota bacterium]
MDDGDSRWRSDPRGQYVTPPCQSAGPAAQQWAEALAAWAIPEEILAAAPQSPYGFDVGMFARLADEALERETPSQQVAREALSDGGSVLDVGCGGGAASLPLAPPATFIVGLDQGAGMLQAFAQRAAARAVVHETIEGAWPDVAGQAPVVDVVVCHNVFYNVSDLRPFVQRLSEHARKRVVVQLTQHHPLSWLNPLWKELHEIDRPHGPTADDAAAVVREAGFDPVVQHWTGPMRAGRTADELVAFVRQRLCLGSERDPEVRMLIGRYPPPVRRPTVTLWWSSPGQPA